ncbi:MAG: methionyl-tRNA formyltransferase [Microcystaceae cyanobacterium]
MRIVFLGTPQFAVPTLQNLIEHPQFEVVAVVTQPDKRRGRGNKQTPSPIKNVALTHQIPVWQPRRIKKDPETLTKLRETEADFFVVVAYGQLLSKEILEMPKSGSINIHGSILPKYRGAAPIQWSIHHGEIETGITTMLLDEGMDTGAMLLKAYTPISLWENTHQLVAKLSQQGADLLIETLLKLETKEIQPISQNSEEATYAPLIKKEDYQIDWSLSSLEIHNKIRAFYPNCVTEFRGNPLKIVETIPLDESVYDQFPTEYESLKETKIIDQGEVGEVVTILKQWGAVVKTGQGFLLLKEVQPSGKRPQSGWDFVNGMRLQVGDTMDELTVNS